jgi:very-short-patch-repair endonuclease
MATHIPLAQAAAAVLHKGGKLDPRVFGAVSDGVIRAREHLSKRGVDPIKAEADIKLAKKLLYAGMSHQCESPIEHIMLVALCFMRPERFKIYPLPVHDLSERGYLAHADLVIIPQFPFACFRLDFLIVARKQDGPQHWLAVECDGDEFHNATIHQTKRDYVRDQFCKSMNITTMRFSGSKIWKDPHGCGEEVAGALDFWHEYGRGIE